MSKENMDEKFSIVIDINENYESYREHAKSNKDEFKNKFVLFYTTWNDAGFYTLLVVRNFYENSNGKIIGTIRICHDDLVIDNNNEETREIRYFLEKGYKSKGKIDITDKLEKEYISIADSCLYDKLKEILIDDKVVIEFLSRLNEISTIEKNKRIEEIKSKEWYKTSFIREVEKQKIEKQKIIDFTIYKNENEVGIKDNSYYVLKNLSKYFDKIKKNIDGFYGWVLKYYLSFEEVMQVFTFIKENHAKEIEQRNEVLNQFKNKYSEYTEFIKEIDEVLAENKEFYEIIKEIKNILRVERGELDNIEIGHYTRLDTIKQLIKKDNENEKDEDNKDKRAYLRLTNGRQMNDPLEGKILLDYIFNKNNNSDKDNISKDWKPTFWYISSATTEMDSLPMWKQYGGNAEGGMLVYDKDYLKSITENKYIEIYRVCYVDVVGNEIKIISTKNLGDDKDKIKKLEKEIKNLKKIKKDNIHLPTLSNIGFLFKKSDYSYENEYRIVFDTENTKEEKVVAEDNTNSALPFLYVYLTEKPLKYSKLILGPKAIDIDYIAPYINYCDKDIEIEKSSISYR